MSNSVIPPIREYEPYTLEDMIRESQKELFSVVTTFSGGGGSSVGYKLGGGKILLMKSSLKMVLKPISLIIQTHLTRCVTLGK